MKKIFAISIIFLSTIVLIFQKVSAESNASWGEIKNQPCAGKLVVSNLMKGSRDRLNETEIEIRNGAAKKIVNILCPKRNGNISTFSGSFISPKGHILTNAHALIDLADGCACEIRQGSPAVTIGTATLVFVSGEFMKRWHNKEKGGHRFDVSILKMNSNETSFPFFEIDTEYQPKTGQGIMIFSYPSEFKKRDEMINFLPMFSGVANVFVADYTYLVIRETKATQLGSSGGVVIGIANNQFAGMILAISDKNDVMERYLYCLTPWAINSVVFNELQMDISKFVSNH